MSLDLPTHEKTVKIEGKEYLCRVRTRNVFPPTPPRGILTPNSQPPAEAPPLPEQITEYSFDQGETWHPKVLLAFVAADKSGKLIQVGEQLSQAGEFEAFVISLVQQVQSLKVGETLKLMRGEDRVIVLKEQAVLAVRASTIHEVDLTQEKL